MNVTSLNRHWNTYIRDIKEIADPVLGTLGINYFGHALVTSDRDYFIIATDDKPIEHTHKKYEAPVCGLVNFDSFEDGVMLPDYDDKKMGWGNGMSDELRDRFDMANPMMISRKADGMIEFFYFTMNANNAYERYCQNMGKIEKYIYYYKDKCNKIIDKCKKSMNKYERTVDRHIAHSGKEHIKALTFKVDKYWMYYKGKEVKITNKEFEVLEKISHGSTVKETSSLLGTSVKTIDNQIRNMKERNEIFSTSDLITMYWKNKIIK